MWGRGRGGGGVNAEDQSSGDKSPRPPTPPRLQELVFSCSDEQFEAGVVTLERVHLLHSYATPVPVRIHVEKKGTPLEVILLINIHASQDVVNRPMMVLNPQVRGRGARRRIWL